MSRNWQRRSAPPRPQGGDHHECGRGEADALREGPVSLEALRMSCCGSSPHRTSQGLFPHDWQKRVQVIPGIRVQAAVQEEEYSRPVIPEEEEHEVSAPTGISLRSPHQQ